MEMFSEHFSHLASFVKRSSINNITLKFSFFNPLPLTVTLFRTLCNTFSFSKFILSHFVRPFLPLSDHNKWMTPNVQNHSIKVGMYSIANANILFDESRQIHEANKITPRKRSRWRIWLRCCTQEQKVGGTVLNRTEADS